MYLGLTGTVDRVGGMAPFPGPKNKFKKNIKILYLLPDRREYIGGSSEATRCSRILPLRVIHVPTSSAPSNALLGARFFMPFVSIT